MTKQIFMRLTSRVLFIVLAVGFSIGAKAAAVEDQWTEFSNSNAWEQLAKTCETDQPAFDAKLVKMKKDFVKAIEATPQPEYMKLDDANDPRLIFTALTSPGDLSSKDEFWEGNKDCANVHWEVRKVLSSTIATKKERLGKIEELKNCVLTRFDRKKLVSPVDQLVKCYTERAKAGIN